MNRVVKAIFWAVWLGLAWFGLWGARELFTEGRDLANYGSYIPWGLWVSAYIYFIGLSAGVFLFSSLDYVFRVRALAGVGRTALWLAASTLLVALASIWCDLGRRDRFWEVYTRPHFTSVMAWMVWLYTVYFVLLLVQLWLDMRCDLARRAAKGGLSAPWFRGLSLGYQAPESGEEARVLREKTARRLRLLGAAGLPLAILFSGGVGAVFAALAARPFWHHSLFPILFLTGALVSGGGLLLAVLALTDSGPEGERGSRLRMLSWMLIGLLLFDVLLEWAEFSIPMWYGTGVENQPLMLVLFGPYWWVFWVVHVLLGTLAPLTLLLWKPASRSAAAMAGGLIAVTFLAVRLNIVIPGQVIPALQGLERAYADRRLRFDYVPSSFEWSIVALLAAAGIALFYLGWRLLPLRRPAAESL